MKLSNKKYSKSFVESHTSTTSMILLVELDKNANEFQAKMQLHDYDNSLSDEQKHEMAMKKNFDGSDPMGW